jgi:hypothetical protein
MVQFTKIKRTNTGIELHYRVKKADNKYDILSLVCPENPLPSFIQAFMDLRRHLLLICEIPIDKEIIERSHVKGATLTYSGDDDILGAVISGILKLMHSNSPLVLNTPHKNTDYPGDMGDPKTLMDEDCADALETLITEAEKYLNGDRAQEELFPEEPAKAETEEEKDKAQMELELKKVPIEDRIIVKLVLCEKYFDETPSHDIVSSWTEKQKLQVYAWLTNIKETGKYFPIPKVVKQYCKLEGPVKDDE